MWGYIPADKALSLPVALALAGSVVVSHCDGSHSHNCRDILPTWLLPLHRSPGHRESWAPKALLVLFSEQAFKGAHGGLEKRKHMKITNFIGFEYESIFSLLFQNICFCYIERRDLPMQVPR